MHSIKTITARVLAAASVAVASSNAFAAPCTVPYQLTNGQPTDATQVMANYNALLNCVNNAPGGAANAVQYNTGSGFAGVGPLTNGQLLIGATSGPPQVGALTPGPNISISNGPGSITISASGPGRWPLFSPPSTLMFPAIKGVSGITSHQADDVDVGYMNYVDMTTLSGGDRYSANVAAITNSNDWHVTYRMTYSGSEFNYWTSGLILYKEGAANVAFFGYNYTGGSKYGIFRYSQTSGSFVNNMFTITNFDQGNFLRVTYTKSSDTLMFFFSKNGKIWQKIGSTTAASLLGGAPDRIGFGNAPNKGGGDAGQIGFSVDYWDSDAF